MQITSTYKLHRLADCGCSDSFLNVFFTFSTFFTLKKRCQMHSMNVQKSNKKYS